MVSVYTLLTIDELKNLAIRLKIGEIKRLDGISDGVVNTNYRLTTDSNQYVLTLVENPEEADALPFIAGLLIHLAKKGIPCPHPITDNKGRSHCKIKGRPAMLASFLTGRSPQNRSQAQCYEIGKILGTIHIAGANYSHSRENPMGENMWAKLLNKISPTLQKSAPQTLELLADESQWLVDNYHRAELPWGICHADLFPDNSFFVGDRLTGVIDFFFACKERYIYDLAVARNAWCFNKNGDPINDNWQKLLAGYEAVRPLSKQESDYLTAAARAAALRFSLSRLHDNFFPRPGETVTTKDPQPFLKQLNYFRDL